MSNLAEADPPHATTPHASRLMRDRSGAQRVTNIELFFDLVYVYAVTQLSHYLLAHPTVAGALQAGLLLALVWQLWAYTTWVTNWLDPQQMAVRLLLVVLMLISLALSASLPRAFDDLGLWISAAFAVQQVGRSLFRSGSCSGRARCAWTWRAAWPASRRRGSAGPERRTGRSRAVTSLSAARASS